MIQTTVGIGGMMCGMCEAHINDAFRKHFAIKSAKADRKRNQCVILSEEPLDEARIRAVVAETGYDLLSVSSEPYQKRGLLGLW